jgi:hypothetical protein
MNAKIFALVALFGLSLPTVMLSATPAAVAQAPEKLQGFFMDKDWGISVFLEEGAYKYRGTNNHTSKSIELTRVKIAGTNQRQVYTWQKGSTKYQVVWQPKDPDFVRLQVSENGRMLVNRLLQRQEEGC